MEVITRKGRISRPPVRWVEEMFSEKYLPGKGFLGAVDAVDFDGYDREYEISQEISETSCSSEPSESSSSSESENWISGSSKSGSDSEASWDGSSSSC